MERPAYLQGDNTWTNIKYVEKNCLNSVFLGIIKDFDWLSRIFIQNTFIFLKETVVASFINGDITKKSYFLSFDFS